jgi:hypothetical protein
MLSDRTPPEIAVKKFKQAGWRPAKKPMCPDCLQTPTPKANLEDGTMSDALTDNRSQPTYPVGEPVMGVMLSVMRKHANTSQTSLGIGLPSDWPWEYLQVTVDLDVGRVVVQRAENNQSDRRKLPIKTKPNAKRRWLEMTWRRLGHIDPQKPTGSWLAKAEMVSHDCLRIDIPKPILTVLREAHQRAVAEATGTNTGQQNIAETVERNGGQPKAPEGEDRSLQDLRDARDMLNQALHDAAAAGHEVEAYVDGNRVGVRRYIRQSEDV